MITSLRFTPAYAGNTYDDFVKFLNDRVHPRIRGEYLPKALHMGRG